MNEAVVGIVYGIVAGIQVAYVAWGLAFIVGIVIAIVSGATASPKFKADTKKGTIGAAFERIPQGALIAILLLFVAAIIITFIFPPWA